MTTEDRDRLIHVVREAIRLHLTEREGGVLRDDAPIAQVRPAVL
jgi:hypothetical protein